MSPRVMPEHRIPDIVQAAASVFSRRGFRLAQMEDIAKEAKVSKATLYYYFKNKIHLFHYVLEHAGPNADAAIPSPESSPPKSEAELLGFLQKQLREQARLPGMAAALRADPSDVDLDVEIRRLLEEMWDLQEQHQVQIVILEKSAEEFPELASIYDTYARKQLYTQLEDYLSTRMRQGLIRRLQSIEATARFISEGMAWFGWKQFDGRLETPYAKSEALPDFAAILTEGLRP